MPYIESTHRYEYELDELSKLIDNEGEMNYSISRLIHNFLLKKGLRYKNINAMIGVLECAKMELYRQIASHYEDKKKKENGPVSDLDKGAKNE